MLFPSTFTQLVRVYNHKAADALLVKHEAAASQRDRCVTALAAARSQLQAAEGKGEAAGKHGARAATRLAHAEAELAKWQERTVQLEGQILEAQQAALSRPLGTAFIALFRCGAPAGWGTLWSGGQGPRPWCRQAAHCLLPPPTAAPRLLRRRTQTAAAMMSYLREGGAVMAAGNFQVRPCPGPDNINWSALWCTWQQVRVAGRLAAPTGPAPCCVSWPRVGPPPTLASEADRPAPTPGPPLPLQRAWRSVAVMLPIAVVMLFPIGVLTGVLSNLNVAVCGGTAGARRPAAVQAPSTTIAHAGLRFAGCPVLTLAPAGLLPAETNRL